MAEETQISQLVFFRESFLCFSLREAYFIFICIKSITLPAICLLVAFADFPSKLIYPAIPDEILLLPMLYGFFTKNRHFVLYFLAGSVLAAVGFSIILVGKLVTLYWEYYSISPDYHTETFLPLFGIGSIGTFLAMISFFVGYNYLMQMMTNQKEIEVEIVDVENE